MRIIVQKFGGTSVAAPERRKLAADRVERAMREGLTPVVVVSAMGRQGEPYATDTLIQLANEACPDLAPREMDLLLSCGEIISSVIMAATLKARGISAAAMTGGQAGVITDESFGAARILRIDPQSLFQQMQEGRVAVVAGFQGQSETGEITTLGRGGSDTSAALVGGALRAEVVEIYTDVDGVMTADPRLVPQAKTLAISTYDEVAQMAHYGAKVVHPFAVEVAMQHRVPLRIRSIFAESQGTLITHSLEAAGIAYRHACIGKLVTGVTHVCGLAQVSLLAPEHGTSSLTLFRVLADAGISIDLINISPGLQRFCIDESHIERAEAVMSGLNLSPEIRARCAKVSVVGSGMRGRPGVMATVIEALTAVGAEVFQTADSHVTISCLIDAAHLRAAVQSLHHAFGLG